jgi:protein-tyrosine-phosphatase
MSRTVLFLCVQNSARSQIAEGFFKKYAGKDLVCISAGTIPADRINPYAMEVMKEVGIDISTNKPKMITNEMIDQASIIINMGCMDNDSCPSTLFKKKMVDWGIEDPVGKPIDEVRRIRDIIKRKVSDLIITLEKS